jgi:hypothetical protein
VRLLAISKISRNKRVHVSIKSKGTTFWDFSNHSTYYLPIAFAQQVEILEFLLSCKPNLEHHR